MFKFLLRLFRMIFGLFIFALGLMFTVNAGLGLSPWNCLNSGIIKWVDVSFGQANIAVGVLLVIITYIGKEKIGLGTIGNMVLVGTYMDIIASLKILPTDVSLFQGIVMILMGLVINSIGVYLYLGAGFGAGPRDGLMLAVMKLTGKPLAVCRTSIELVVLAMGIILGGSFGIGTVLASGLNGIIYQSVFKLFHFNPKTLHHEYIEDYFKRS